MLFGRKLIGLGVAGALLVLGPISGAQAEPPGDGQQNSERVGLLQRLDKLDRLGLLRPGQDQSGESGGADSSPTAGSNPSEPANAAGSGSMVIDPSDPETGSPDHRGAPPGQPDQSDEQTSAQHPAAGATSSGTHPRADRPQAAPVVRTVTLVTGDRVRLEYGDEPGPRIRVTPGRGRERVTFDVSREGAQVSVVPSDARRLLEAGRVDPRLFDVTGLVRQHYHDDATDRLPLLVESEPGSMLRPPAARAADRGFGIRPLLGPTRLSSVGMVAADLAKDELAGFWGPLQTVITDALDPAAASLVDTVRAPMARTASDSDGVSGIDVHSMDAPPAWRALAIGPRQVDKLWLDGRVRAAAPPAGHSVRADPVEGTAEGPAEDPDENLDDNLRRIGAPAAWRHSLTGKGARVAVLDSGVDRQHPDLEGRVARTKDFVGGGTADRMGHGTHVASVLAGSGEASDGTYRGVAPDARLFVGRVLDERGAGAESEVIAGMEWAVRRDVDVVNVSLGDMAASDGTDPMSKAANRLGKHALIVAAAGNGGPDYRTISAPGAAERVLAVAAVHDDGETADFSSRGPRRGDSLSKPDIAAPGVNVVGARARGTEAGPVVAHRYVELTGTSMAVPYVSGAAAILVQAHPDWTPRELERALTEAARSQHDEREQGAGELDIERLMRRAGPAEQASGRRANATNRRRTRVARQ